MKTIAYIDLNAQHIIKEYVPTEKTKRVNRITEAIDALMHTGSIAIYLIDGKKRRLLTIKSL